MFKFKLIAVKGHSFMGYWFLFSHSSYMQVCNASPDASLSMVSSAPLDAMLTQHHVYLLDSIFQEPYKYSSMVVIVSPSTRDTHSPPTIPG